MYNLLGLIPEKELKMKELINPTLVYPTSPPKQPPMPEWKRPAPGQPPVRPDPSTLGLWGAHDPALFRDPDSGEYFAYCTHQNIYRSRDLISWTRHDGPLVESTPAEAMAWTNSRGLWAPDILKVGDEYRMYCSNSSFGVQLSCIYLAVSDRPEGPYRYRGIVVRTDSSSPVNAIDANPIIDVRTGHHYMAYGSFWGGIRLLRLDPATGLALESSSLGSPIARRPRWADRAIEGAYIRYNPDTDYYYLFASYGSLSNDYNIRVARSRDIAGPYLDYNGRPMLDGGEDGAGGSTDPYTGTMIAAGCAFSNARGWMAPGHNSVLADADGAWYLCCHIRPYAVYGRVMSTMHIRKLVFTPDGWPLISPEPYAGERLSSLDDTDVCGRWEYVALTPTDPQTVIASAPASLARDGSLRVASLTRGSWRLTAECVIELDLSHRRATGIVMPAYDAENDRPCPVCTAIDERGVCVWMKKIAD